MYVYVCGLWVLKMEVLRFVRSGPDYITGSLKDEGFRPLRIGVGVGTEPSWDWDPQDLTGEISCSTG